MNLPEDGVAKLETLRHRKCGPCRVCCKVGFIDEWGHLPKGEAYSFFRKDGTWCQHVYEGGCMVHPEGPPRRPITCARFRCAWLNGSFAAGDRPDQLRMLVTREYGPMGLAWVIREMDPWVAEQGKGLQLFSFLRKLPGDPVLVVTPGPTVRYWLPGAEVPQITDKAPKAHRKESLAWLEDLDDEHVHEMELQPGGVRLCSCGYVDMRKEEVADGDPEGRFRGSTG